MQSTKIEVLLPDFAGNWQALNTVLDAKPDVVNHNIETVPRLYKQVRPQATFERSLELLKRAKEQGFTTKSGIMLGLGESEQEVLEVMEHWLAVGCDIITIGQYMQPTQNHLPVVSYVSPEIFARLAETGKEWALKMFLPDHWCEAAIMLMSSRLASPFSHLPLIRFASAPSA